MSLLKDFHGLPAISCDITLSLGHVTQLSRHVDQLFYCFYLSVHIDKLICMLAFFIFLCLNDWYEVDLLPYLVVTQVWSFFFHWLQSYLWLLSCPLMTNRIAVLTVPQFLWTANCRVQALPKCKGGFPYFFCCPAVWYVCAWCVNGYVHTLYFFVSICFAFLPV